MRGGTVAEGKAGAVMQKTARNSTRPDTRPSVADGWAGAEMRVFGRTKPLIELQVSN